MTIISPTVAEPAARTALAGAGQESDRTGAIERPLVFPENDRPGIMLADAARTYVNRYGVRPGNQAVVFTACDTAYEAALGAGVEVRLIADGA